MLLIEQHFLTIQLHMSAVHDGRLWMLSCTVVYDQIVYTACDEYLFFDAVGDFAGYHTEQSNVKHSAHAS